MTKKNRSGHTFEYMLHVCTNGCEKVLWRWYLWKLIPAFLCQPLSKNWRLSLLRKTDRFLTKFALKITTKSAVSYRLLFGEVCPENSREIGQFSREFTPKNTAKVDFFVQDLSEALLRRKGVQISVPLKMKMSPKILAKGTNCPPVIKS